ncbi:MAG: ATPase, T2SS/T4P/T4SS family [Planctomycetota bacterium]
MQETPLLAASALLAEAPILMSIAKPLLTVAIFVPYMRYVAKFEPDARFFNLPVAAWNFGFIGAGVAALACVLFIPIFWVGWPLAAVLMASTMFAYWKFRDARVPERARFSLGGEGIARALEARKKASAEKAATVLFTRADGAKEPVPQKEDPALPVYIALESLLVAPVEARASRVDLVAAQGGVSVSMVVDGLRVKRDPLPLDVGNAAIDLLKRIAGLDVADRRRRQAGACKMDGPGGSTTLNVTTIGSSSGQSIRIDFDREQRVVKPIDSLGLEPKQLEALRTFEDIGLRRGVIIVSAPPGQGLTTLGYALIARHDAYTSNIKTLEREQLTRVEGVDHAVFAPQPGAEDYAAMLTKIIRRDPDVVLAADISEPGSAKAATTMGMQSPLVYVLIPSDSASAAVATWLQSVGDPKTAAKSLSGVVHQRTLRTLCPNCKAPFTPAPEQAKKLGIPSGKQVELYRPSGKVQVKNRIEDCPVCQGSAYFGQTGIFEVLALDDEARKMLAEGDFRAVLARAVRDQRMIQLQEAALLKVREGLTSLEEVQRVFAPKQQTAPAAKPAAAPPPAPKG